ncbi:uncharacterized protein LOC122655029 [Telopea speciosissima]|uniref:uncharacterized protein LOC122655029 n=1 Tax=Telopea speciosissima TaxID=54955 RepID=UPI001CC5FD84|nr:uncharacterized protein LOC122655029 [Telopea speciosissima]
MEDPFCIIGDFNELLNQDNKLGGKPFYSTPSALSLSQLIDEFYLEEIKLSGSAFTWSNRQKPPHLIRERLDRAFCSPLWLNRFPLTFLTKGAALCSDHNPIVLNTSSSRPSFKKLFHFQFAWVSHPDFNDVVSSLWDSSSMDALPCRLTSFSNILKRWNRDVFGHVDVLKMRILEKVSCLETEDLFSEDLQQVTNELKWVLDAEEAFWLQKSRQNYIVSGDRNTRFFHTVAKHHVRRRWIDSLVLDNGERVTDPKGIAFAFVNHFSNIFTSASPLDASFVECLFLNCITASEASVLCSIPSLDELRAAVFSLGPFKAPGVDGFQACFFSEILGSYSGPSLSVCRANAEDFDTVKAILDLFSNLSGQEINYSKSGLFFSRNVPDSQRVVLGRILDCPLGKLTIARLQDVMFLLNM